MMLTQRQETILNLIVDHYTKTASPIGSGTISNSQKLGISPATIRKEVAVLDEAGYITRSHSSAGSIPLHKAYKLYVKSITTSRARFVPISTRKFVRRQLRNVERQVDEWTYAAANILAKLVGNMAITTFPKAKQSRVQYVQLVQIQKDLVMLIIVMEQAHIRRELIRLSSPIQGQELEITANRIRTRLQGLTLSEIEARKGTLPPFEEKLIQSATVILRDEDRSLYSDHYVDGLRNLFKQPEFSENARVRSIVSGLEDGSLVQAILKEIPEGGMVKVRIGGEDRGDILWPLSIVICQYGVPHHAIGVVGAIGPTRMEYNKTISSVQFMSSVMSDLVETVHS